MAKPVSQIFAVIAALVLTVAPAMSCCLGFAGTAHAAMKAGTVSGTSGHGHCADGGKAPAHAPNHKALCSFHLVCGGDQVVAQAAPSGWHGLLAQTGAAPVAVPGDSQADFMPALLRVSAPPQGPPVASRTPVSLNTTLRL